MNLTIDRLIENKNKIADLIDSFAGAMNKKTCKEDVLDLLHRISAHTGNYFINEHLFMEKYQIPTFESHRKEHELFVEKMKDFHKQLEGNTANICEEVISFLKEWYENHILGADKEIIEFIEKNKLEEGK